jgi:AraC-like DNA-binding protein
MKRPARRQKLDAGQLPGPGGNDPTPAPIPFTRVSSVLPVIDFLDAIGAPTESLLRRARISSSLSSDAEAIVPLHLVHNFAEQAARREGISNLGLLIGQHTSAFDLGTFGQRLQRALTVHAYLQTGIRLIGAATSGGRFWLTTDGDRVRFNQFTPGQPGAGRCHADCYTLAITINMLRRFGDPHWSPDEICLLEGDERLLGDRAFFGEARIVTGQPHTSFTIPGSLLQRPMPGRPLSEVPTKDALPASPPAMPTDFPGAVEQLVIGMLADGYPDVHLASEVAGVSVRTLQRRLAASGFSYSEIVNQARMRLAGAWLRSTNMPITEIAESLGYFDAANFARAFRRQTGMSPRSFRQMAADS